MITTIKFAKLKKDAIIPSKSKENAGYDIYPCFEEEYIHIPPHETILIPTGICSAFGDDYVMILKERGSTGTKGLAQRCGVIDSGFRGEWFVPITNTNEHPIFIAKTPKDISENKAYPYNKAICQALLLPVPEVDVEEYTPDEIKAIPSKRGDGMLGSTNK